MEDKKCERLLINWGKNNHTEVRNGYKLINKINYAISERDESQNMPKMRKDEPAVF